MQTENEIAQLKSQVATLRREMDELKQFIRYNGPHTGDDDKPEAAYITIRCAIFQLAHPAKPNQSLINMMGSRDGGVSLTLMDTNEKTRVMLQFENEKPEVSLFNADGKGGIMLQLENEEPTLNLYGKKGQLGTMLKVVGEEERGQVGVCQAGKPRAIMQARDTGGGISVVHDDGHPRVAITSEEGSGDLLMVTADMQVGVKLSSNGQEGGFITINRANGKAGVILANVETGGAVIVNDAHGQMIASLPSTGDLSE